MLIYCASGRRQLFYLSVWEEIVYKLTVCFDEKKILSKELGIDCATTITTKKKWEGKKNAAGKKSQTK